jgi:deoxyribodipyrimidine photo-lyase
MEISFPSNRTDALSQLEAFVPHLADYAAQRNRVVPGHPHVSRLSPAIRCRLILETEVVEMALRHHSFSHVEKFVQEVVWRSYWKSWLELRPTVWTRYRGEVLHLQQHGSVEMLEQCARAEAGETGVDVMDAFAQELTRTGYLHNHARMWFASYWVHVLRLPWALGADFFYRHLLDADPASNTLSWRWVAGLQTKGKTYLVRRSNLEKYASEYILRNRGGLDRLNDDTVEEIRLEEPDIPLTTPMEGALPLDLARASAPGLWLHGEDLLPEVGELAGLKPKAIAAFVSGHLVQQHALSASRQAYQHRVLRDGLQRASQHFELESEVRTTGTLGEGLTEWAREKSLRQIVAFLPTVGPLRDQMPEIQNCLKMAGVELLLVRRESDAASLPMAKSGYFNFWQKVSRRLSRP